jgi:hypothetical protein
MPKSAWDSLNRQLNLYKEWIKDKERLARAIERAALAEKRLLSAELAQVSTDVRPLQCCMCCSKRLQLEHIALAYVTYCCRRTRR